MSELNVNSNLKILQGRMKDLEYLIRIPKGKPLLNKVQRKRRVQWAKEHVSRDLQFWKSIIFSDESKFVVLLDNGEKLWQTKDEDFNSEYI